MKLEYWNIEMHSQPEVIESYGGWILIKNLPLNMWNRASMGQWVNFCYGLEILIPLSPGVGN